MYSFGNLPSAIIKIPVQQEVAALLLHLFNQKIGAVNIGLEDLKVEGANLVISSIIDKSDRNRDREKSLFAIYENDELKNLKQLVNELIEEKFVEDDEDYIKHYSDYEDDLENEELEEQILKELEDKKMGWGKCWEEHWIDDETLLDF